MRSAVADQAPSCLLVAPGVSFCGVPKAHQSPIRIKRGAAHAARALAEVVRPRNLSVPPRRQLAARDTLSGLWLSVMADPNSVQADAAGDLYSQRRATVCARHSGLAGFALNSNPNPNAGCGQHGLDSLAQTIGSREAAFAELQRAVDAAYKATGQFPKSVDVRGTVVRVQGAIVDNLLRINAGFR